MPKFSIVIPLYNKEEYIAETIESVLCQSYTDYEIIVVNDSSTDNSLNTLKVFQDDRLRIYTKPNGGVSDARNYGILKAYGEYIAFLDADDLWKPDYLANRMEMITKFPGLAMYAGGYTSFIGDIYSHNQDVNLLHICSDRMFEVDNFFECSIRAGRSCCLTSAVVVRKSVFDGMEHPFPIGVSRGEDVDLWTRISLNHSMAYCNDCLMLYRVFATCSLNSAFIKGGIVELDYTKWFEYQTDKSHYISFVNMFLTIIANQLFRQKQYREALSFKLKCRRNIFYPRFMMSVKLIVACSLAIMLCDSLRICNIDKK